MHSAAHLTVNCERIVQQLRSAFGAAGKLHTNMPERYITCARTRQLKFLIFLFVWRLRKYATVYIRVPQLLPLDAG